MAKAGDDGLTGDETLLSSEQVAAKLNISSRCVLNWLYAGIIPAAVHVGKVIRFREDEVMAALEAASNPSMPATGGEAVVRLAMWLVAPDAAEAPPWMLTRDPTADEERDAARLAAFHLPGLRELETQDERRQYVQGVIDASHMISEDGTA